MFSVTFVLLFLKTETSFTCTLHSLDTTLPPVTYDENNKEQIPAPLGAAKLLFATGIKENSGFEKAQAQLLSYTPVKMQFFLQIDQ